MPATQIPSRTLMARGRRVSTETRNTERSRCARSSTGGVFGTTGKGADWRHAQDRHEEQTYPTPADVFFPIGLLVLVVLSLALVGQILIATQVS
jgi:hypothetical protein